MQSYAIRAGLVVHVVGLTSLTMLVYRGLAYNVFPFDVCDLRVVYGTHGNEILLMLQYYMKDS